MRIASRYNNMLVVCLAALACWGIGCSSGSEGSPTNGKAAIYASEDLYPIVEREVQAFQQQYPSASITLLIASPREAIAHLVNDSVKLVIVSRPLTAEEASVISSHGIQIDSVLVAYDGIAVIANASNHLAQLSTELLRALADGKKPSLKSVGGTDANGVILAFGGKNSDMREEFAPRILHGDKFIEAIAPCTTTTHAISFVGDHPAALGFIGLSWVSQLPKNISVLAIGDTAFKRLPYYDTLEYFPPHPAHLYRNYYPLRRSIYVFSRGTHVNVDKGFLAFLAGREGQSVFNKNGLVPATMPVRLVP
jgi:phosphate transport system substrate-binding protein